MGFRISLPTTWAPDWGFRFFLLVDWVSNLGLRISLPIDWASEFDSNCFFRSFRLWIWASEFLSRSTGLRHRASGFSSDRNQSFDFLFQFIGLWDRVSELLFPSIWLRNWASEFLFRPFGLWAWVSEHFFRSISSDRNWASEFLFIS